MHFSIPDSLELYSEAATTHKTYTGFNIYINGNYHCVCRYKQLHSLHEQLRRACIEIGVQLPLFPPKRLLPLTNAQLESRRYALEHYLQMVGQNSTLSKLDILDQFLLKSQLETAEMDGAITNCTDFTPQEPPLEVTLMNGYKMPLNNCLVCDNTNILLKKFCQLVEIPEHLQSYFCLYLVRFDKKEKLVLMRRLMNFESPYVSSLLSMPCQILLRKSYWNPRCDLDLMQNTTALNFLFIETVSDIEREWIIAQPEVYKRLRSLQEHGLKKEYLELAQQLPHYGCLQFPTAIVDYPEPQTEAIISIGNKELTIRTTIGVKMYETKFRVTRMRCWRLTAKTTIKTTFESTPRNTRATAMQSLHSKKCAMNLQLSFEYLMSKQNMRWVTISSEHSMLMSVCLQAMVDELLNYDETQSPYSRANVSDVKSNTSPRAAASSDILSVPVDCQESSSQSLCALSGGTSVNVNSKQNLSHPVQIKLVSQSRLKENEKIPTSKSYSSVFFRKEQKSVHNEAFEGIGDEDL